LEQQAVIECSWNKNNFCCYSVRWGRFWISCISFEQKEQKAIWEQIKKEQKAQEKALSQYKNHTTKRDHKKPSPSVPKKKKVNPPSSSKPNNNNDNNDSSGNNNNNHNNNSNNKGKYGGKHWQRKASANKVDVPTKAK